MGKKTQKLIMKRIIVICIVFLLISVMISSVATSFSFMSSELDVPLISTNVMDDDSVFLWEDTFNNTEKIDDEYSQNYVVDNGKVSMYGTFESWTDAKWTRMVPITIESDNSMDVCIFSLEIEYDNDMQADYDDLRFKYKNETAFSPYWIEQRNPDPNNPYAIVWIRLAFVPSGNSDLYMFYGNPSAGEYSQYDAVFDETSWQKQFAHDEQITYHMAKEGAWDPEVSWGNNRFLVTWEEGQPYSIVPPMLFQQQIRGSYYDANGNQINSRFDITPVEEAPFRNENPSAASNGDIFFVAFEKFINPLTNQYTDRDIYGSIVTMNGQSTVFDICTASGIQADPQVVYDSLSDQFLVLWEDGRSGTTNYNIYARFFSDDGVPVSDEMVLTSRPQTQCEPWVAFDMNHHHFYVAWEEGVSPEDGPFEIWGQLFDANLNSISSTQRLSEIATDTQDYNFPCVAYSSVADRFFVTWQQDDISQNDWTGPIYGIILDTNGDAITEIVTIASGQFERSEIVTHLSSSFFVTFDGSGDIWGRPVTSDGETYDYILQISDSESDPADWASIGSNGEQLFIAWEDTRIEYGPPYEAMNMPDVFANIWSYNTPESADVTMVFGNEKQIVLEATVVSYPINPENLLSWDEFYAVKSGAVYFDVLDAESLSPVLSNISSGESLTGVNKASIRLRARFLRSNPASSPLLDAWNVSFYGEDYRAPETTIKNIDGVEGLNGWYTSESVTVWLHAVDYPEQTGSGVDRIYYTINGGNPMEYDDDMGIHLTVSQQMQWTNQWNLVFWAVDRAGNVEENTWAENRALIKIDADRPYVSIFSPTEEEEVAVPFLVEVDTSDNVGVTKVEFDIEPFGERPGLPYVDTEPPFEWYCDVDQGGMLRENNGDRFTNGVNVMLRAEAFDDSGQSWTHEIWIHIKNWDDSDGYSNGVGIIAAFGQKAQSKNIANENSISSSGFMFGPLTWEFEEGFTFCAGDQGAFTKTGPQTGSAELFIGISNKAKTVFFGFASMISIS